MWHGSDAVRDVALWVTEIGRFLPNHKFCFDQWNKKSVHFHCTKEWCLGVLHITQFDVRYSFGFSRAHSCWDCWQGLSSSLPLFGYHTGKWQLLVLQISYVFQLSSILPSVTNFNNRTRCCTSRWRRLIPKSRTLSTRRHGGSSLVWNSLRQRLEYVFSNFLLLSLNPTKS